MMIAKRPWCGGDVVIGEDGRDDAVSLLWGTTERDYWPAADSLEWHLGNFSRVQ